MSTFQELRDLTVLAEKSARMLKAVSLRVEMSSGRLSEDEHDVLDIAYDVLFRCATALRPSARCDAGSDEALDEAIRHLRLSISITDIEKQRSLNVIADWCNDVLATTRTPQCDPAVTVGIGRWLSAALDDPQVCEEMKADIRAWFDAGEPPPAQCDAGSTRPIGAELFREAVADSAALPPSEAGREALAQKLLSEALPYLDVARRTYVAVSDAKKHSDVFILVRNIRAALSPDPGTVAVTSTDRGGAA